MTDWYGAGVKEMQLEKQDLAYLARESARPDNPFAEAAEAEITRRAAQAQIDAARWMKWSVIAIAATSGLTALFGFLSWMYPHAVPH